MPSEQFRAQLQLECSLVLVTPLHTEHMVGRNRTTLPAKHYKSQLPLFCNRTAETSCAAGATALPTDIYLCPSPRLEGIPSETWRGEASRKLHFLLCQRRNPLTVAGELTQDRCNGNKTHVCLHNDILGVELNTEHRVQEQRRLL